MGSDGARPLVHVHEKGRTCPVCRGSELASEWRERARRLEVYAETCRRSGDPREAEDAESAAVHYIAAAERLELGLAPEEPST